jgi:hypothetical protein
MMLVSRSLDEGGFFVALLRRMAIMVDMGRKEIPFLLI